MMQKNDAYAIGLDYGSDSARAVLVDAFDGTVVAQSVCEYSRWKKGLYCDSKAQKFRQHPLDYIESLNAVLHGILDSNRDKAGKVRGIGVDTTASTPCLVNSKLMPLALDPRFSENPDAMFVLWKDHSAFKEALEIESVAGDYLDASSGTYSPECYWPKLLHVLRSSPELVNESWQFLELCDFIPNWLCGNVDPSKARISHGVVAVKMLNNPRLGGLPPRNWFEKIDSCWMDVVDHTMPGHWTCDKQYGVLSPSVAAEFGLPSGIPVACGMVDSFCGAIGAGIAEHKPVLTLGTSSGYITVSDIEKWGNKRVRGAFSQAEGFVYPGMFSVELGLSAFGDAYAWLSNLLAYLPEKKGESVSKGSILVELAEDAAKLPLEMDAPFATDYFNGRRSPDQNPNLWASIMGLRLRSTAPELYRAIVEATCFGTRAFIDRMNEVGEMPEEVICIGGISQKSHFVMQMMADICGIPMKIYDCKESCAQGAAMIGAAIAGLYPTVQDAQAAMLAGIKNVFLPDASRREFYNKRYELYQSATQFTEHIVDNFR